MRYCGLIILLLSSLLFTGCGDRAERSGLTCDGLNLQHVDHLYDAVELEDGSEGGIIHIYSEYPDYSYAIEPQEGYTCVDDVARAVVLLTGCEEGTAGPAVDKMIDFILFMQSESGYFYNFIWHDGSINRTYRTTRAVPDWWSWRAFWALESYAEAGEEHAGRITAASGKLAERIFEDFLTDERKVATSSGLTVPDFLPGGAAADQSGVLVLALEKYYQRTKDERAAQMIMLLCDGIMMMQAGDSLTFPYGAFLSWNNLWHAYGNVQSYALMRAGALLGRQDYIHSALLEVDHFYPYLIENGYLNYFILEKEQDSLRVAERQRFPQIAYGFRPMIFSCVEAWRLTGETSYLERAKTIGKWFSGDNVLGRQMYDPETGRGFDAINSEKEINRNAGAESTIEALLSMQMMTKAGINMNDLYKND